MSWSFINEPGIEWPFDGDGEAIQPAFLTHIHGSALEIEITLKLLEAYGIPYLTEYPNNGLLNKLILGTSPSGIELYVPATMLEDAKDILNANPEDFNDNEYDEEV